MEICFYIKLKLVLKMACYNEMYYLYFYFQNVITNADVATMLRQTLDDNIDANCLYEPKFTRAKIR